MKRTTKTSYEIYINEKTGALTVRIQERIKVTYGGGREFWKTKEYSECHRGQLSGVVIGEYRSYWGKSGKYIDEMYGSNIDIII